MWIFSLWVCKMIEKKKLKRILECLFGMVGRKSEWKCYINVYSHASGYKLFANEYVLGINRQISQRFSNCGATRFLRWDQEFWFQTHVYNTLETGRCFFFFSFYLLEKGQLGHDYICLVIIVN